MWPIHQHTPLSARFRNPRQILLRLEMLEQRTLLTTQLSPVAEFGGLSVDPDSYEASRILVRFQSQVEARQVAELVAGAEIGAAPLTSLPDLRIVHLAPTMGVQTALSAFRADPRVLYAEPDYRVHLAGVPDDARFNELWNLNNVGQTGGTVDADIDAPGAWDITVGSGSTVVAVIDTGVNYNHADLAANMWINPGEIPGDYLDNDGNGFVDDVHGYDFANSDANPMDDHGHGTHVAGTIGAVGNNGIGVAGINWNVKIMALKFLGADGSGSSSAAIEALNYAVANGAGISNNSWGGDPYSQALFDAIAAARAAGHIFVTAAGNGDFLGNGLDNDAAPFYPASYELDNIVAVAAVDHDDNLASFSNYGATSVDLAAPGVNILSTTHNGAYGLSSGTSMASPHVAGVVALVRDLHVAWSHNQVISQVLSTVDPLPGLFGVTATGGRLNVAAAVGNPEPPIPPGPPGTLPTLEDFTDGLADFFQPRAGNWNVNDGRYDVTPVTDNPELFAVSTLRLDSALPPDVEFQATLHAEFGRLEFFGIVLRDYLTNSFLIFDYQGLDDFKFAGADIDHDRWLIGHVDSTGWRIDASLNQPLEASTDYHVRLLVQNGTDVTLEVGGFGVSHSYLQPLNDGAIGVGMRNSISHFDDILLREYVPPTVVALPIAEDFEDPTANHFLPRAGVAGLIEGRYQLTPFTYHDAVSTLWIGEPLPTHLELQTTINADDTSPDRFSNAFVIFDYLGPTDFKFAGAFVGIDEWVIGHRDPVDWIVDAVLPANIEPLTDYRVRVLIEDGHDVTLFVDGVALLGHSFADSLTDGALGLGTKNAISRYDDLVVQEATPPQAALPIQEDFQDGGADDFRARLGSWSVAAGQLSMTPGVYGDGISTLRVGELLPANLELRTTFNADDRSLDRYSNAFVIFDYVGPTDFKFAGAFVGADQWLIGHRDSVDWIVDAELPATIEPLTDYDLRVLIENDRDVTLFVGGVAHVSHSFGEPVTDAAVGLGTQNALSRFDELIVQATTPQPPATLPMQEDFQDGGADDLGVRTGSWSISNGRLGAAPTFFQDGISTLQIGDPLPASLELWATINAADYSTDRYSNAFVIFDYVSPTDFKFAGAYVGIDEWAIGHRDAVDWIVDAVTPASIEPLTDYRVRVLIEDDHDVTLFVNGVPQIGYSFADALTDGALGLGTKNAVSHYDDLLVQEATVPHVTLPTQEDFEDGGADHLRARSGSWSVTAGQLLMTPDVYGDGISTLRVGEPLPANLELRTKFNADDRSLDRYSNAFVIFDYVGPTDFKFAGAFVGADEWLIGHRDPVDWNVDAVLPATVEHLADYHVRVLIANDRDVTLFVDGVAHVSHSFTESLTDGALGLGTQNAISRFDDLIVQAAIPRPPATLPMQEDFQNGEADHFGVRNGSWSVSAGRLTVVPTVVQDGIGTLQISDPLPVNLELQATFNAADASLDRFSNAFVIFDYAGPTDFKFAGAFVGIDEWVIGHRDATDWIVDVVLTAAIEPMTDYRVRVLIEGDRDVTLFVDDVPQLGHSFADSLTDGALGLGTKNAISGYDDLVVRVATPFQAALPLQEDFQDGGADFRARGGSWRVTAGQFLMTPAVFEDGISTLRIGDLPANFELQTTFNADGWSPDRYSNAFVIFDYAGPTDFKFAGAFVGADQWVIGHRDSVAWIVDAVLPATIEPLTDFRVRVLIENDRDVTLFVSGVPYVSHAFADSLTDGALGLGTQNAISRYDDVIVTEYGQSQIAAGPRFFALPPTQDTLTATHTQSIRTTLAEWPIFGTVDRRMTMVDHALLGIRDRSHRLAGEQQRPRDAELRDVRPDLTDRVFADRWTWHAVKGVT